MGSHGGAVARTGSGRGGVQALDDDLEDEGDVLLAEVDRRANDAIAGKREIESYSSGAEYLRHMRKMLNEDSVED